MFKKLLFNILKRFVTKGTVKQILFEMLDAAAEEIVVETNDEVGTMTVDEAVVLVTNRIKVLIDKNL